MLGGGGRSLKSQMRHANAKGAAFAAIIGENEVKDGEVTLRDLSAHTEQRVRIADIARSIGRSPADA
jgi:histidyl-tRNA synthetase